VHRIYLANVLYRRLIAEGIRAAKVGSLVGPPPTPSGMPLGHATAAVIEARARLEAPRRSARAVAETRRAASA
jgi:hypothetical protein